MYINPKVNKIILRHTFIQLQYRLIHSTHGKLKLCTMHTQLMLSNVPVTSSNFYCLIVRPICQTVCIRYNMVYSGLYECNEYNPL